MEIKRVPTGIPGLDKLIEGGLPKNSLTLVCGTTGSGKTLFTGQFVHQGAAKYKEPGVFLTLEERADGIRSALKGIGLDPAPLEEKKALSFVDAGQIRRRLKVEKEEERGGVLNVEVLEDVISDVVKYYKVERFALDSLTSIGLTYKDERTMRMGMFRLTEFLRDLEVTTVLTTEIPVGKHGVSRWDVEEFTCEGVIVLGYEAVKGTMRRTISVWKMRYTDHDRDIHPFKITSNGVQVLPEEKVY